MTTIQIFEKNDSGSFESTEVNWKKATAQASLYYLYPIRRPVAKKTSTAKCAADYSYDYNKTSDLVASFSKTNYIKIQGTNTIHNPQIILCSPIKTKIYGHFELVDGDIYKPMVPVIVYGGSGWADGINFDEKVGTRVTLKENGTDESYATIPEPTDPPEVIDPNTTLDLPNYLMLNPHVCVEINVLTGAAESVRYTNKVAEYGSSANAQHGDFYTKEVGTLPGTEVTLPIHANSTYLFAKTSNSYSSPSTSIDNSLGFASSGNRVFDIPLGDSPENAINSQSSYNAATLYSPYITSQLRVAAAEGEDVGNSPEYRIVFKCTLT